MANEFWTSANVDPKRKYRFVVEFAGAGGIGALWFAKTVDKPEITVNTGETKFMQHTFYYPGTVQWNEINLTLVDPVSPDASAIMLRILQESGYTGPQGAKTNMRSISKALATERLGQVVISQLSADGETQEKWPLKNAFITKVSWDGLDYSSEELSELTLTMRYDWASCEVGENKAEFLK